MTPQFLALATAIAYAGCYVTTRHGLACSNPMTAAYVAILVNTLLLWTAVFLTGGIPDVPILALLLFIAAGLIQLVTRITAYTGVAHLGASITSTIQATNPLVSGTLAIIFLDEVATLTVFAGTGAVMIGVILISWNPQRTRPYRLWELLFPLTGAFTAGVNHPIRRYALILSDEPLFCCAIMGTAALVPMMLYMTNRKTRKVLILHQQSIPLFICTGIFEAIGIWILANALSIGNVVTVAPVAATTPLWVVLGTLLFSRQLEQVTFRNALAAIFVVGGIIAISIY